MRCLNWFSTWGVADDAVDRQASQFGVDVVLQDAAVVALGVLAQVDPAAQVVAGEPFEGRDRTDGGALHGRLGELGPVDLLQAALRLAAGPALVVSLLTGPAVDAVADVPLVLAARLVGALTALEDAALAVTEADRLLGQCSAPLSSRWELVMAERWLLPSRQKPYTA